METGLSVDLDAVETGAPHRRGESLAKDRPNHLRTGLDVQRIGQPNRLLVGEARHLDRRRRCSQMKMTAQVAEVTLKILRGNFLKITRVAVANRERWAWRFQTQVWLWGTFGEAAIEVGACEHTKSGKQATGFRPTETFAFCPTLWWAEGHRRRPIPRGTGSRWGLHPPRRGSGKPGGAVSWRWQNSPPRPWKTRETEDQLIRQNPLPPTAKAEVPMKGPAGERYKGVFSGPRRREVTKVSIPAAPCQRQGS